MYEDLVEVIDGSVPSDRADGHAADPATAPVGSDEELVQRLVARDPAALAVLIDRYRDHVFSLHEGRFGPEVADDLTQETFLRLINYLGRPAFLRRGFKSPDALVERLSWRVGCRYLRGLKTERKRSQQYIIFPPQEPPESDAELLAKERSTITRGAITSLPPALRTVATLYYLEHKTPGEIARQTGLPLNTVDVYLHRVRKRLRNILGPYWKGKDHV
jgi:RNA polymerase sigma factor (sigma-70 family)